MFHAILMKFYQNLITQIFLVKTKRFKGLITIMKTELDDEKELILTFRLQMFESILVISPRILAALQNKETNEFIMRTYAHIFSRFSLHLSAMHTK